MIVGKEKFFRFSDQSESRYRNEIAKAETVLYVIREGGPSLPGWHEKGAGAWVSHYNTRVPIEVKNFLSQKIFQLFLKIDFLRVSGL